MSGASDESVSSPPEHGLSNTAQVHVQRRTISPYDITANDNPGNLISHTLLKEHNYSDWSRDIRTALRSRKKFGFVDGSIPRPSPDSEDLDDWWTINSLIVSWIRNTIDASLRPNIPSTEVAADLWTELATQFSASNGARMQSLKSELASCRQHGMSVATYFGKLRKLWDEIALYEKIPTCSCGGCQCRLSDILFKQREEDKTHQFLLGLDDTIFGTVSSSLLSQTPLPSLASVYSTVQQEESKRAAIRAKEDRSDVMALSVQPDFQARVRSDSKDKSSSCTHCGRAGHSVDSCFEIHGFPDWWSERGGRGKHARGRGGRNSGRGRGQSVRANAAQTSATGPQPKQSHLASNPGSLGLSGITPDQWKTLVELVNATRVGPTDTTSGLPDGKHVSSVQTGTVWLTD
ncbi:PREDICTED: uncharacterized protein LOC104811346, partial [Tarenaya hassleriana]|uniref:uncharacterized protein LOC104811346 n=1 Tax=Tarenaya hassleriana TaxID=28532 RepID=UPI00053CA9C1